jgi:glycosyltransferase involved in cell wall biosynthesis
MLSIVDGITVSTPKLKEIYSQFNENIVIIPNHLAKFIWKEAVPKITENKRPRIIYPCSMNHFTLPGKGSHGGDMGPKLLKFIQDTVKDYDWQFIGGLPNELIGLVKSGEIKQHPWLSVYHYPDFLKSLNADIGIAPLEVNDFNRCKSSIKQLEYVACGIPGVYTNIDPYDRTLLKSSSEEEFIANIETLAKDPDLRLKVWEHDYEQVKDELFWEDNNNIIKYVNSHLSLFGKELGL